MTRFRKLEEKELLKGPVISVGQGRFEAPDGTVFERQIVHHPGAVVVVPVTDDGTALLVSQYRAATGRDLLELPAGKRDVDGEEPEVTARRELAEEIGMEAARLELLARFYNSPGFCDEFSHLFLATDLSAVDRAPAGVEEGHMTMAEVDLREAPALVAQGRIEDAKTIIGLCLAAQRLLSRG